MTLDDSCSNLRYRNRNYLPPQRDALEIAGALLT
jgi:hypothetical protein